MTAASAPDHSAAACRETQGEAATVIVRGLARDEPLLDQSAHNDADGADIRVRPFGELGE